MRLQLRLRSRCSYTYTISVKSLRNSLFFSDYLSEVEPIRARPDTRPDTINTRPRRRPSVQLETDRPGIEASKILKNYLSQKCVVCSIQ